MADNRHKDGYRVIGHTNTKGELHVWYFPSLGFADAFAKQLCQDTGKPVDVTKYLGTWQRAEPPVEFVKAADTEPPPPLED